MNTAVASPEKRRHMENVIEIKNKNDRAELLAVFAGLLGDRYHLVYLNSEKQLVRWDFGLERTVFFLQLLEHMEMKTEWRDLADTEKHEWGAR